MKRFTLFIFFLILSTYPALGIHLGDLKPGQDHSITFNVRFRHFVTPNEIHYATLYSSNFEGLPIAIKTADEKTLTSSPTVIETWFKDTGFDLTLSCEANTPAGEYQFILYTYAYNPQGEHIYKNSIQYIPFSFRIGGNLALDEIPLWHPPLKGEPWEDKIISRHTIRISSNQNWQLSVQGVDFVEGLNAVFIEKGPECPIVADTLITDELVTILNEPKTVDRPNEEVIYTIILYVEDYTIVPAGETDIGLYIELETVCADIFNLCI